MRKILITLGVLVSAAGVQAELAQQFKDPTFNGAGWASHVLTLEQMRQGAQNSIDSKAAAERAALAAEASNTPMAKFMSLFTGQVYSQLATQLTNNLFCTKDCNPDNTKSGEFNVSSTQQISWAKEGGMVTLSVFNGKLNSDGITFVRDSNTPVQSIIVPISSFAF